MVVSVVRFKMSRQRDEGTDMIYFEGREVDQPSPATTIGKRGGLTVRLAERLAFWRQTGAHGHVVDAGGLAVGDAALDRGVCAALVLLFGVPDLWAVAA